MKGRNRLLLGFGIKNIGIDFGIVNIIVYIDGKGIVLWELFVVVCKKGIGEVIFVGFEVWDMIGWILVSIVVIWLMKDGVIVDYDIIVVMMKYYMDKVLGNNGGKLYVMVCVLSGIIEVEKWVVVDVIWVVGVCDVYVIEELYVVVIGVGLLVMDLIGLMVVDIGGGMMDVVMIFLGGIVFSCLIWMVGDKMNDVIV